MLIPPYGETASRETIYNALRIQAPPTSAGAAPIDIVCEVEQHIGENRVRAVAMQSEKGARIVQARREKSFARTACGRRGIGRFHDPIIVSVFGPGAPERRAEARRA